MSASTKLSTAVKAICFLAESAPEPKTSFEISDYTGINASKLRKILSMLVKSEIVESTYGLKGGFILKKSPDKIHLQEIYCAIEDRKAFHLNVAENNPNHFTDLLNGFFLNLFSDIQIDIENKMKTININQIIQSLK
ncbi:MAG: Rrf2 family transcriptional regulator [Ignavibacteriales bacterium]|nr:MAG: Rrf2 family transcriptional regulator [Ignavibacteriales bacterium]